MAFMFNMAHDWTYDLFVEDAKTYTATAQKGVHCRADAGYREYFMVFLKNMVRDFREEWGKTHEHVYDRYDGYVGDAFARKLRGDFFSDFYKDAYGQRPHLDTWFYVHALGLPTEEDTIRTFCARPVEDAIRAAQDYRDSI